MALVDAAEAMESDVGRRESVRDAGERQEFGATETILASLVDDRRSLAGAGVAALEVGDRVPDSDDWSAFFTVDAVEPPHTLVLHSTRHVIKPIRTIDFSWAFVIRELSPGRSRLYIRARTSYTPRRALPFVELVIGPADFVNAGAMLRGIKKRAESARAAAPGPGKPLVAQPVRGMVSR